MAAVSFLAIAELVPYARNARTHSAEQVAQIAASIVEFGWTNPVLADADGIVCGHGRVLAAGELYAQGKAIRLPSGVELPVGTVPVLDCTGWSAAQRRAYVLADNKLALNAGWDVELLQTELADLAAADFDVDLIGFTESDLAALVDDEADRIKRYVRTVNTPVYEPKGLKPAVHELVDRTKAHALMQAVREAVGITTEERDYLLLAAARHHVFDYHLAAEYYCHASPRMQSLMQDSALVIIDFDKAIADGFVHMSARLGELYAQSYPDDDAP